MASTPQITATIQLGCGRGAAVEPIACRGLSDLDFAILGGNLTLTRSSVKCKPDYELSFFVSLYFVGILAGIVR